MQSESSEFLQRLSGAIEGVAKGVSPSVVSVGLGGRSGSGVVLDKDGRILTANHVVHRLDELEVGTNDGESYKAEVLGKNPYADLALLKVEAGKLAPIEPGDGAGPNVGQFVLALANPFSSAVSVTTGVVTGVNRRVGGWRFSIENAIVTDARLNPGYSGGPLVDAAGRMVGMNVAYMMNRGIAVPVDTIRRSVEKMAKGESARRAYLGITSAPVSLPDEIAERADVGQESALMVYSVEADSAARKAGLAFGDVLLKFGENRLSDMRDLEGVLDEEAIGKESKLVVLRGGELKELKVSPSSRSWE